MHSEASPSPDGMIIIDDVTFKPILDFEAYSNTIVKMITQSHPKFSIGIYGEWGTGKTTLMKVVEEKLQNENNILTVWFNAWRYEREDQFAIVALLKTIGYAMGEHPIYKRLKPILLNAVKIIGKGFLSEIASKYIGEKGVEEFKTKVLPRMDFLSELDKDTIYFDGIYKIENEMRKIMDENRSSRVVVFIDDLDRCSPKKALEVFESIKVFLGLDGFVYVVGLSHVTISKLITAEYKESGVKGEQYIKKIIQIPIILPEWNTNDVGLLIDNFLSKGLINEKYKDIIRNNSKLISDAVENNPREVKRFINNYIVAYEIHSSNKEIDPAQLLLVQALNVRWSAFYRILVTSTQQFRELIFRYAEMEPSERIAQLDPDKRGGLERTGGDRGLDFQAKLLLGDFKLEHDLWNFLKRHNDIISKIKDWEIYRRAAESVKEIPTPKPKVTSELRFVVFTAAQMRRPESMVQDLVKLMEEKDIQYEMERFLDRLVKLRFAVGEAFSELEELSNRGGEQRKIIEIREKIFRDFKELDEALVIIGSRDRKLEVQLKPVSYELGEITKEIMDVLSALLPP